jgi:membrane-bound serine protease (ClpP class)
MTGDSGMIGEIGVVKTVLDPVGRIQVHGELWSAHSRTPVAVGQKVRVVAVEGLTLEVAPDAPE